MSFLKTLYRRWFPGDSAAHRFFWKYRYSFRDTHLSENEILLNINHPHRQEIIKEFNNFTDVRRILELGSSWGPNLLLLSQIDPKLFCLGIDISGKMVAAGSQYFKSRDIKNIQLINGDMISLKNFADKEFDLILTDASLIYIDKNDILHCAEEM